MIRVSISIRFVTYCGRGKGFSRQVNQLIPYLVMVEDDNATLFAAQGMLEGQSGITTIAGGKEVGWSDVISH
jgi:hypothetical protein